jgi:hypothetical protein
VDFLPKFRLEFGASCEFLQNGIDPQTVLEGGGVELVGGIEGFLGVDMGLGGGG